MRANTAVRPTIPTAKPLPQAPASVVAEARGGRRYLLSTLRDRRSLRQIGGLGAYLRQVSWSIWWNLRD